MRRIATGAALLVPLLGCGCRTISTPWSRSVRPVPGAHPLDPPEVRTARDAVPDAKMIPDPARVGPGEAPGGM